MKVGGNPKFRPIDLYGYHSLPFYLFFIYFKKIGSRRSGRAARDPAIQALPVAATCNKASTAFTHAVATGLRMSSMVGEVTASRPQYFFR